MEKMEKKEEKREKEKKPQIVIVGNGFGGVYSARHLASLVSQGKIDVSIYGRSNHFLFTPLLHEVATGGLSPLSVVESLDEVFRGTGICFSQSEVTSINLDEKYIEIEEVNTRASLARGHLSREMPSRGLLKKINFDYIIIAGGATTNSYGIAGVEENCYFLKNLTDALEIRNRIIDAIEDASDFNDVTNAGDVSERKSLLSFAVVGGGPTGVELASEISEFAHQIISKYYSRKNTPSYIGHEEVQINLINAGNDLIPQFSVSLRKKAKKILEKNNVSVYLNTSVTSVTKQGVQTKGGNLILAGTTVWVAGVMPSALSMTRKMSVDPSGTPHAHGRILVNKFLQIPEYPFAFALGDIATFQVDAVGSADKKVSLSSASSASSSPSPLPPPLPMLAQVAEKEAKIVAYNIHALLINQGNRANRSGRPSRPLREYKLKLKGMLISLGQWKALGDITVGGITFRFSGPLMWWVWRTVFLFKFLSWRKRFEIATEWTVNLFSPRDISRL
jgi:NADH dehydrogenase